MGRGPAVMPLAWFFRGGNTGAIKVRLLGDKESGCKIDRLGHGRDCRTQLACGAMHAWKICALALCVPAAALAQADISLQIGTHTYRASGQGECKSAPRASIYNVPAALMSVSHRAGRDSLHLSLWQPTDGKPAMLTLSVTTGGKTYLVDTVRDKKGSGKAVRDNLTIVVDAVAASGEKITGKIQCRSLGAIQAEGG